MDRRYWVTFILVAFVVGLIIGFGSAFKASRVMELENQVKQLTQENADLKAKLAAAVSPVAPAAGPTPTPAGMPTKP